MDWINVHTHHTSSPGPKVFVITELDRISEDQLRDYFCLGLHPWFITQYSITQVEACLEKYHRHPNFIALGEIGLDRTRPNLELQREVLKLQLELAKRFRIPRLVIHNVGHQSEIISVIKEVNYKGKLLWHGLNPTEQEIDSLIQRPNQSFIGVGHLIFTQAKISSTIKHIPLESLLFETDDQRDLDIQAVYAQAAQLLEMDLQELKIQIQKNFHNFLDPA